MSLPVQSCSDDELEGYASIHPEAAQELARRIAAGQTDRESELEDLQSQLRQAEEEVSDLHDERSAARRSVNQQLAKLRDLQAFINKRMDEITKVIEEAL